MELNTYFIEGGVGKCVAFTALIPKLAKKNGQKIQIHTSYKDCFVFNPDISAGFDQTVPSNHPQILKSDNIYYCEPYKSNFIFGKEHLIQSYCKLFGVEYDETVVPKLYTSSYRERANNWLRKNKIGKYMMIQFSGGQPPIGWNPANTYQSFNPGRNYPPYLASQVINKIKTKYPYLTIIDCTLTNEPTFKDTIKCDEQYFIIHELLKEAEGFIGIDSCLNHFSASTEVSGVVVWGSTRWTQFGYTHNTNLHYFMEPNQWDESKYVSADPRNVMVDPNIVFNEYVKVRDIKNLKVSCLFR
jgi:hypothetical protein